MTFDIHHSIRVVGERDTCGWLYPSLLSRPSRLAYSIRLRRQGNAGWILGEPAEACDEFILGSISEHDYIDRGHIPHGNSTPFMLFFETAKAAVQAIITTKAWQSFIETEYFWVFKDNRCDNSSGSGFQPCSRTIITSEISTNSFLVFQILVTEVRLKPFFFRYDLARKQYHLHGKDCQCPIAVEP